MAGVLRGGDAIPQMLRAISVFNKTTAGFQSVQYTKR